MNRTAPLFTRWRRPGRVFAGCAIATLLVVALGCSSDDRSTPVDASRPLTLDEAGTMAELLYANYQHGGAEFVLNTLTEVGGAQLSLSGEVDWTTHTGWANVSTSLAESSIVGALWTPDAVLERRPALDAILTGMGYGTQPLVARSVDTTRRLDQAIAIIVGMAATTRDNAQLIMQTPGSAFVRDDTLRDRPVHVYRYGTRNLYWVDAETGEMLRLEATSKEGGIPTVVDLLAFHAVTVEFPTEAERRLIDSGSISDVYDNLPQL